MLYRLFGRVKTPDSLKNKLELNPQKYQPDEGGKKIQDVIGLRITLYFTDDVDIAIEILKKFLYGIKNLLILMGIVKILLMLQDVI